MRNLKLARKLALLIGLCLGAGTALVTLLLFRLQAVDAAYSAVLRHEVHEADRARVVQVNYKKQVQEWKNILLRGSDPAELATYRQKFLASEAEVQREANELLATTGDPAARVRMESFLRAHTSLGEPYRAALRAFEAGGGRDFAAADRAVKGRDREATDIIDGIVAALGERIDRIQREQAATVASQRTNAIVLALIALLGVLGMAVLIARDITHAQREIIRALEGMVAGEMEHRLDENRRDEMGQIARSLNAAIEAVRERQETGSAAAVERERAQSAALRAGFQKILGAVSAARAGDLTHQVDTAEAPPVVQEVGSGLAEFLASLRDRIGSLDGHAAQLAAASEELSATARELSGAANETSSGASATRQTANGMTESVEALSTSAEQMASAIRDITQSAQRSRTVAVEAVRMVEEAQRTIAALGESSNEIGNVVKMITSIAEQTNLLALNATIEAARAGEAGKGFAIVAREVKDLARETAKATDEIGNKVSAIQSGTGRAVTAIQGIRAVIENVNEFSATVAAAVEEHTAVTNEVRRTLGTVAQGTGQVSGNVATVEKAAEATTTGAKHTQAAAGSIASMAAEMKSMVGEFRLHPRNAHVAARGGHHLQTAPHA